MSSFYKLGAADALSLIGWTPELRQALRDEDLLSHPLIPTQSYEAKGRRIGVLAGLPLVLAGGAGAGLVMPSLTGLLLTPGRGVAKSLGASALLLGGILAPKTVGDAGAAIGRYLDQKYK